MNTRTGWLLFAAALTLLLPLAGTTRPLEWWPVLCLPAAVAVGFVADRAFWWLHGLLKVESRPVLRLALRLVIGAAVVALLLAFRWYGTDPFAGMERLRVF